MGNFAMNFNFLFYMEKHSGLFTEKGQPILSAEYVEKLREEADGQKKSNLFIAQKGAQETDLHTNVDILVTGGNRGGGKANPKHTPVATPTGWRKLGDLEIGDKICTPYNGIQKVCGIYEQGINTVYALDFDDGTSLQCMDNHRFLARFGHDEPFMVTTAREIFDRYKIDIPYPYNFRKGVDECVELPLCGEVKMNEDVKPIDLPVHPFLLGVACGKGKMLFNQKGLRLTPSKWDSMSARSLGYTQYYDKGGYYYLRGVTKEKRREITTRRTEIDSFIPDEYMTASVEARWAYIQGVWRSNGRMKRKHPYIEMQNKKYINQIADMLRSLGGWVKVSELDDDPEKAGWFKLVALLPNDKFVFSNARYKEQAHINANIPKTPNTPDILSKKILRVRKCNNKVDCRCITVTGRDHLYMTENYTVNHNTVTMLTKPLYDIDNKHFNGIIFRKNKDDFENIVNESIRWFDNLGKYNKSKDDMTWNFKSAAKLKLSTYDMPLADFDIKYRGQQFAYIGIDELPQMPFEYFKFLMTCSRNTIGVRSQILGTCNPDPLSWLRKFLDWWIGKADTIYADGQKHPELKGFIIPERDGVIRYCYMPTDSVDDIVWGNTPEEVYEQCKETIDAAWDDKLEQFGYDKKTFAIKSVTFVKAALYDNKALLKSDPAYIANLLNQPLEVRMREFDGNWDVIKISDDLIKAYHLDKIFQNPQMLGDRVRRATCDVAGDGGDNCVTWLWIGKHVQDVYVCRRDPYTTASILKAKLEEWGVLQENFAYDLNGMGQVLKGAFPRAVPFNNQAAVAPKYKYMYDCLKSQCAYMFYEATTEGEWSIEPSLLSQKFKVGKNTMTLYNILQLERKAIKKDTAKEDRGWCIIHKEAMKNKLLVGHSPDFIEALFMRWIFDIKSGEVKVPSWIRSETARRNGLCVRKIGFRN